MFVPFTPPLVRYCSSTRLPKATVPGPQAGVPDSAQEITGGCGESARAATSRWMSGEGEAGAVTAGAGLGPGHVPPNLGLMADPCRTGGPSFLPSVRVVIRLPFFSGTLVVVSIL
ncbi:hypothetical protein J6590_077438 [Homalodisca vitripennis]|nr:hypothetical protein J6590_077438 [Homalodisca vitripennis]